MGSKYAFTYICIQANLIEIICMLNKIHFVWHKKNEINVAVSELKEIS